MMWFILIEGPLMIVSAAAAIGLMRRGELRQAMWMPRDEAMRRHPSNGPFS